MVYVSSTKSLAALEILVHIGRVASLAPFDTFQVSFPEGWVEELAARALPADWHSVSVSRSTQELGDGWASECRSPVLRVPSAIIHDEHNYLLNPLHPEYPELEIEPSGLFDLDPRLLAGNG